MIGVISGRSSVEEGGRGGEGRRAACASVKGKRCVGVGGGGGGGGAGMGGHQGTTDIWNVNHERDESSPLSLSFSTVGRDSLFPLRRFERQLSPTYLLPALRLQLAWNAHNIMSNLARAAKSGRGRTFSKSPSPFISAVKKG